MPEAIDIEAARRTAACLAFKHVDELDETKREEVLVALIDALPEAEAEKAERALFFMREQRRAQMELAIAVEALTATKAKN